MDFIKKAYEIAAEAHEGQIDKGGNPYINHPLAVAKLVKTEIEKTVALLHDVVEDTSITLHDLKKSGFSKAVIDAVDCITKREAESLSSYLARVKSNSVATIVKIADLTHNSEISRIPTPSQKDYDRLERYKRELDFLHDPNSKIFS
jgi:metal dependent phosphohydrolase, HD domain